MATFDFQAAMDNAFSAINRISGAIVDDARMRQAGQMRRSEIQQQQQFQADQAELNREAQLEGRRIAEQGELRRVEASERSADARLRAAEDRMNREQQAEETRLKRVARDIATGRKRQRELEGERSRLAAQVERETQDEIDRRVRQAFSAGLNAKQKKALAAMGGNIQRFLEAAPEDDRVGLESILANAQSAAEEAIANFTAPSAERFQVVSRDLEQGLRTLTAIESAQRNAGWTDFIEELPASQQADAAEAASVSPLDAAAARAAQAIQAPQAPAQAIDVTTPSGAAQYLQGIQRVAPTETAPAAIPAQEPANNIPDPRTLLRQMQPAPQPAPQQPAIPQRNVPQRNVGQTVPQFNPAEFARLNFGIDVDTISPADEQGMLQLAMQDGYTQPQVAGILEQVRNGDPQAIAVVREYQSRWNASRGARPQSAPMDLAALV